MKYKDEESLFLRANRYSWRAKGFALFASTLSPLWVGITAMLFFFGRITADEAVISNCCAAAYLLITSFLAIHYNKLSAKFYDELISIVEDKISRIEKQEQIHKI